MTWYMDVMSVLSGNRCGFDLWTFLTLWFMHSVERMNQPPCLACRLKWHLGTSCGWKLDGNSPCRERQCAMAVTDSSLMQVLINQRVLKQINQSYQFGECLKSLLGKRTHSKIRLGFRYKHTDLYVITMLLGFIAIYGTGRCPKGESDSFQMPERTCSLFSYSWQSLTCISIPWFSSASSLE